MNTPKLNRDSYVVLQRYAHQFSISVFGLFAAPKVDYIGLGAFFYAPIKTLKEVYMGHIFYLSKEKYYTVGTTITLLFIILLTIIAFMWIHIEQQDEIISNLHMKISERERSRSTDKDAIRAMCWKELFDRIDNSQKQTIP